MTEGQWRRCADPVPMLAFLSGLTTGRKLRLFAVACARRAAHVFPDDRLARALDAAERLADRVIDRSEWEAAEGGVRAARSETDPVTDPRRWDAVTAAVIAVSHAATSEHADQLAVNTAVAAARAARPPGGAAVDEDATHANLVREVFEYPLRPVAFSPQWRTSTAVALAAQVYAARDFSVMPVLADALQDAGCESKPVLEHCRAAGHEHVRGCWVLDRVLGKE